MFSDIEHIRKVLGAEILGKPLRVASKKTLFGIPSHVETVIEDTVAHTACEMSPAKDDKAVALMRSRVRMSATRLGARLIAGRADRYFIWYARVSGYEIPAYPYDPAGQLDDFLSAAGAKDLPEWYALAGLPASCKERLQYLAAVVLLDNVQDGHAVFVEGVRYVNQTRFVPLNESELVECCPASALAAIDALINDGRT